MIIKIYWVGVSRNNFPGRIFQPIRRCPWRLVDELECILCLNVIIAIVCWPSVWGNVRPISSVYISNGKTRPVCTNNNNNNVVYVLSSVDTTVCNTRAPLYTPVMDACCRPPQHSARVHEDISIVMIVLNCPKTRLNFHFRNAFEPTTKSRKHTSVCVRCIFGTRCYKLDLAPFCHSYSCTTLVYSSLSRTVVVRDSVRPRTPNCGVHTLSPRRLQTKTTTEPGHGAEIVLKKKYTKESSVKNKVFFRARRFKVIMWMIDALVLCHVMYVYVWYLLSIELRRR